jgi:putative phosphoesterase
MGDGVEHFSATRSDGVFTVGVVSDTHVPDRAAMLHPQLLQHLREANVDLILHAGDICVPSVLKDLEQIAPVRAVCGNRDWAFWGRLPLYRYLDLAGTPVILMHGHGGFMKYVRDKFQYFRNGYRIERYLSVLQGMWPAASVIVFGHTHFIENYRENGKLIFNPGSASMKFRGTRDPSFGLLHFSPGEVVRGEVIYLEGVDLFDRRWRRKPESNQKENVV